MRSFNLLSLHRVCANRWFVPLRVIGMPMAPPDVDEAASAPSVPDGEALARIRARLIRPLPADRLRGWLLPLALTVLAGIARFWRITRPGGHVLTTKKSLVFDETYYAHDSWTLLHHGVEANGPGTGPGFVVHPPLGKWMMAMGELLFDHGKTVVFHSSSGNTIYPASLFSFRFAGALVGTLAILMVARIGRRMFRSTALGVIAGALLALDGLEFVQSRTAMLDIFLMFWVLAAFGCLVVDRDDGRRRLAERLQHPLGRHDWGPSLGFRPWRLAAGLCIGGACATKWDGAFYIPALLALAIAWDIGARRTAGASGDGWHGDLWLVWRGALSTGIPAIVTFLVVPAAVYVASWTGWFLSNGHFAYDHDIYLKHGQSWLSHDWAVWRGWWHYQDEIWGYANNLTWDKNPHPYLSRPWGWLIMARPVAYYYETPHPGYSQEVLGLGNPALWWAMIPALIATAWAWVARRDWRASALLLVFLIGYLPWFREDMHHRVMFFFYMLPEVPFMALIVTFVIGMAIGQRSASSLRQSIGIGAVAVYLATVVVLFGFFYPVLAARTIPYGQWHERMWLHTCQAKPDTHHENAPCWI
jgi:dolichyl-phosphate-mannose-protein mannosyltransferase